MLKSNRLGSFSTIKKVNEIFGISLQFFLKSGLSELSGAGTHQSGNKNKLISGYI
jgi:hypothetical protein